MDEENNENEEQQELPDKLINQGKDAIKDAARDAAKKVAKKVGTTIAKAVIKILAAILPTIMPLIIAVVLICGLVTVIKHAISEIDSGENMKLSINQNGTIAPSKEEFIEGIDEELKSIGISKTDLGMGTEEQANKYLYEWKMLSLATQSPYISDFKEDQGNIQGIVKIKKCTYDGENIDLEFKTYEEFSKMINNNDSESLKCFAIDDSGNDLILCVAKESKVVINEESSTKIEEVRIPYETLISNYTIPFSFLINLQQFTSCPKYVSAVSDMIKDKGEIELTIFESKEIVTTITDNKYLQNVKIIEEVDSDQLPIAGIGAINSQEEKTPVITTNKEEKEEVSTTNIETITVSADVTSANIWVIKKETDYKLMDEPEKSDTQTTTYEDEEPPENEGYWKTEQSITVSESIQSKRWVQESNNITIEPDKFLGLWKNSTGTYKKDDIYNPKGIQVKYDMPLSGEKMSPLENLFSAEEMFYYVLENNEKTQFHAQIMKELIAYYKAGGDYTINVDYTKINTNGYNEVTSLYGSNCEERIWWALLDAGYNEYSAAGVMGNLQAESGFITNNVENCVNIQSGLTDEQFTLQVNNGTISKDKFIKCEEWGETDKNGKPTGLYGYGLAQWTWPSYKEELYDLAKSKGVGIENEALQIEYLIKHMQRANYSKNATSVSDAAYEFHEKIEKSADNEEKVQNRAQNAESIYAKYNGKSKPGQVIIETVLTGENKEKMQAMINEAIRIANDDRYLYSQTKRDEEFYFDCSSFCARLYEQFFGINIPGTTGDYGSYGYVGPVNSVTLQPGDILWKTGHVEMWIGNNQRVGAHGREGYYATHPQEQISVVNGKGSFTSVYRFIK